jgi:hypothetical protein
MASHVKKILPNVLALLRCIHALWTPAVRQKVIEPMQQIFDVEDSLTATLLGSPDGKYEEIPSNLKGQMKNTRSWLAAMRTGCYTLLGRMTSYGEDFYALPSLANILINSVFVHMEHMENRHLSSILKLFIVPFVLNCPRSLYEPLLAGLLPILLQFIGARLQEGWTAIQSRAEGGGDETSAEAEIVGDKILRDLTREYASWMAALLAPAGGAEPKKGEKFKPSHLCRFLLGNDVLAVPILKNLIGCIVWPDSLAFRKAVGVLTRILPLLFESGAARKPALEGLLGRDLVMACITSLNMGQHSSGHSHSLLQFIKEAYLALTPQSEQVLGSLSFMTQQKLNTFKKRIRNKKENKAQLEAVKELLWPAMAENPKKKIDAIGIVGGGGGGGGQAAASSQRTWFETTDNFDLRGVWKS